jgi:putative hemolysin
MHAIRTGTGWVVGGGIALDRLKELTGLALPTAGPEPINHLSAWVAKQLAEPIRGGEVVQRAGVRVVVRKVRRQKVLEAQVQAWDANGPAVH